MGTSLGAYELNHECASIPFRGVLQQTFLWTLFSVDFVHCIYI